MDLSDSDFEDTSQSDTDTEEFSSLDRTLEVTRSPSQDDVLPLLECPVCFNLPLAPIRTCIQGHIICAECCCRLDKCPLCQRKIDIGRNFFAEQFLNKSVIKCKFKVDGCTAELQGEKMKTHMQTCEFRPLKCKACNARIPFSDFETHMLTEHRIGRWDLNDQGVRIVVSQKQRAKIRPNVLIEDGPGSLKFICTSLLFTVIVTAFIDYYWYDTPMPTSEYLFW